MKIYHNGKEIRDSQGRFTSIWKNIKWFFKRVAIGFTVIVLLATTYALGQTFPGTSELVPVAEAESNVPPILQRIAKCESPTGHMKNGKVVFNKNTNGSYDMGKYQINTIWLSKAAELNLNPLVEEQNEKLAEWIYANRGTGDWASSSKCWSK